MTIRRQPVDFVVREKPSPAFLNSLALHGSEEKPFAVYVLEKTSLATPDAIVYLAKALDVTPGDISYAGLKDKHARTVQLVSVQVRGKEQAAALAPEAEGPNWKAERVGWSAEEVLAACIEGNSFEIVVRDLSRDASAEMGRRAQLLATWIEGAEEDGVDIEALAGDDDDEDDGEVGEEEGGDAEDGDETEEGANGEAEDDDEVAREDRAGSPRGAHDGPKGEIKTIPGWNVDSGDRNEADETDAETEEGDDDGWSIEDDLDDDADAKDEAGADDAGAEDDAGADEEATEESDDEDADEDNDDDEDSDEGVEADDEEGGAGERGSWALVVVNYFGAQRFGSARHGEGFVGRELIRGDFEKALRLAVGTPARKDAGKTRQFTRLLASNWGAWGRLVRELPKCPERRAIERLARGGDFRQAFASLPSFTQTMCVEAYQSLLWNRTARLLAERLVTESRRGVGPAAARRFAAAFQALRTQDEFGEMYFPPAACTEEDLDNYFGGGGAGGGASRRDAAADRRAMWRQLILPILGKNSELVEPWKAAAAQVLGEEKITTHDLRITGLRRPFFGEAPRPLFVLAENFFLSPEEPDEMSDPTKRMKRTVRFDLPRGAYATVVLRALGQ
jgi:tRNA(Glu) U13 pseudouridine synthase TruD